MMRANKAELIIEHAFVIGIVVSALLAMQTYMKRGIQGVIKTTADELAAPAVEYYKQKGNGLPPDAQWLGYWEKGLLDYAEVQPPTVTAERNIRLTESPLDGAKPIRTTTINQDETKTSGKWEVLYNMGEEGTFTALEKTKGGSVGTEPKQTPLP